jgi:ABC-type transporter Mla maintaining outer membrane lipid asymmetry permease subunit MlaE
VKFEFAATRQRFDGWLVEYGRRLRKLLIENPRAVGQYLARLARALAVEPSRLRERLPPLRAIVGQTFRTFMRGWPVVVGFAIAIGLGLGAVADRFGVVILPLLEQTVLLAVVRDGAPLILALFLAARMGASIAARLADDRQTPAPQAPQYDAKELLALTAPHLIAGALTGWWFYRIAVFLIVAGFRSLGDLAGFWSELWGGELVSLDRALPLAQATAWGTIKAAAYGLVVALTSCSLGVATNEGRSFGRQRAIDVQNAVWESGVLALFICMLLAAILWQVQPNAG